MAQYSPLASSGSSAVPVSIKAEAQYTAFFHCLYLVRLQSLWLFKG